MPRNLTLRIFLLLLAVSVPPLALFGLVAAFDVASILRIGPGTLLFAISLLTIVWAGIIAIVASRSLGGDLGGLIDLARLGGGAPALSGEERRIVEMLRERDRQIHELATYSGAAPIAEDARSVARHVVETTRSVTADATWSLAVLDVDSDLLEPGVYGVNASAPPAALTDLERWASVAQAGSEDNRVKHVEGQWGSFLVIDVESSDELRALLLAPWEGRPQPPPGDVMLYSLVGQHAAAALEHAILYSRLRSQAEELNRLAAVQADFLRGVTHDLQTPLTSIAAVASDLRSGQRLPLSVRNDLDAIAYQSERLRRMVSQLLTMSRLEAGVVTARSEIFRAEPMVQRVWDSLRAERELVLEVTGPDRLAIGDPDRFEQALWAVLDNAVKYSPRDSTIRVTLDARPVGEAAADEFIEEIAVADDGIGMDAETRQRARERFYRSDQARQLVPDGSGIGLYTASQLLALMGGELTIEPRPEGGTTVRLTLPAEPTLGVVERADQRTSA